MTDPERESLNRKIKTLINACHALNEALIKSRNNEKELKEVIKDLTETNIRAAFGQK